jgi:anti-sigma regulatory factor (Ser/Thr protein kinase)
VSREAQLGNRSQPGLLHEALVVDDDETFVAHVAPFLLARLDEGPAVAVLNRRHWSLLRDELGAEADRVSYTDCHDFYTRPIDALAGYDATLRRLTAAGATSMRVVGEIPLGPMSSDWADWISYEAILNRAFADRPTDILCVYETSTAPDSVIDAVSRTHPHVVAGDHDVHPHFHDPRDIVAEFTPAPELELPLRSLSPTQDAIEFRQELSVELAAADVPPAQAVNMLIAANEVFENAVRHGGGPTALRAGLVDGWFACEIEDRGGGLDDPLAGYLPPTPGQPGRAGLWIARQLASRVELIHAGPGLTVRVWL